MRNNQVLAGTTGGSPRLRASNEYEPTRTIEAAEPNRRRSAIDEPRRYSGAPSQVLLRVAEHIPQRQARLSRRSKHAGVIAIGEDSTVAIQALIHGLRQAYREALKTARQRAAVLHLGKKVHMIPLY